MATVAPIAGRYELRTQLDDDGVKQVWAAYDRQLDRDVSVELATAPEPEMQARFLTRAKQLAAENHPHLVTVYDTGVDNGQAFAVLEPVVGATLAQRLHDGPPFSLPQVVELGVALCSAAAAAMQRDLEVEPLDPANVVLRDGDHVKLTNLILRPPPAGMEAPLASEQPVVARVAAILVAALQPPGTPVRPIVRAGDLPTTLPATMRTILLAAIATRGASIRTLAELRQALSDYRGAAISTTRAFAPALAGATGGAGATPLGAASLPMTRAMPAGGRRAGVGAKSRGRPSLWFPVVGVLVILLLIGGAIAFAEWLGSVDVAPPAAPPSANTEAATSTSSAPLGGGIIAFLQRPSPTPPVSARPSPTATATPTAGAPVVAVTTPTVGGAQATATVLAEASATAGEHATETATAGPSATPTVNATPSVTATPAETPTPTGTPAPPTATPVPTAAVPMVVGRTVADATQILSQAGFAILRLPDQASAAATAGTVLAQDPPATSIVPLGAAIRLTVSSGPPMASVPNVVGQAQQNAQAALSAAGLTAKASQTPSRTVPEGNVISQNPGPGTAIQPGSAVAIVVSAGNKIAVPNVVGMPEGQAQDTIRSAGLTPTFPNRSGTTASVQVGQVESESPQAGTLVAPGTTVYINVRSQ